MGNRVGFTLARARANAEGIGPRRTPSEPADPGR